jgi:sialate O-acetylesterase
MLTVLTAAASAAVRLPALFTDHMVLQRDLANPVWGWAEAGEQIAVVLGEQTKKATADDNGRWRVVLDPLPAGGPHKIVVEGNNRLVIEDVLVGEVWVCSGQSNMAWTVSRTYSSDLTGLTSDYPQLRMITVPRVGTQEPQDDFDGDWQVSGPDTVQDFSAVGYFFGRVLHQALDVPVGLIHDSWGGSACEAWVPRPLLEKDARYQPLIERWVAIEKENTNRRALDGNARPGNLYNGMLHPIIGYGIRGAIWYQGESNASRAYQYRHLFPLMIQSWRDAWKQGEFSFYWVQLADFMAENDEPMDSAWAELREAQTMTLSLPNTGEAVIIDIGEGDDIHPRNKEDVGERLARWALAQDYNIDIAHQSPTFQSMQRDGNRVVVTFDHTRGGLMSFDTQEVTGFEIAGEDRQFVNAQAEVVAKTEDGKNIPVEKRNQVVVRSDKVANPVAVRYAWANNPQCNLRTVLGLPATPFRTDDWPGLTVDNK